MTEVETPTTWPCSSKTGCVFEIGVGLNELDVELKSRTQLATEETIKLRQV